MSKLSNYIFSGGEVQFGQPRGAGYLIPYGNGMYRTFFRSGTFIVPPGVTSIRIRVHGAGGAGGSNFVNYTSSAAETTSFGNLISATGGESGPGRSTSSGASPGIGVGGDFQSTGGRGGTNRDSSRGAGGGGAGSILGNGGSGGASTRVTSGPGGGVSDSGDALSIRAGSAFGGLDALGGKEIDPLNESEFVRFPMESFSGRGGYYIADSVSSTADGGSGGGGIAWIYSDSTEQTIRTSGRPGPGGGGAGGVEFRNSGFDGGIGAGGGGADEPVGTSSSDLTLRNGGAGGGFAIGVFSVSPGDEYIVTVALGDNKGKSKGGDGLVVVEW